MDNYCAKRRRDRSSPYVMYDDVLILVFNELDYNHLRPLRRVSQQFDECIVESLKRNKSITFVLLKADLSRRLDYVKSFTKVCPRIKDLDLKDCYLDESIIALLIEGVKHLKRLSLINCRIHSFSEFVSTEAVKTFTKKPIEVTIKQIDKTSDNTLKNEEILALIPLFENIVKLRIELKHSLNSEKVFEQLGRSLNYISVFSTEEFSDLHFSTDNIEKLTEIRVLYITGYLASEENIRSIINSLNLKRFSFRCNEMKTKLMQEMAKNQKELRELCIYWSEFKEYTDLKKVEIFENVRHFLLHDPKMSPNQFKQNIDMFPNIKTFLFYPMKRIQCSDNEEELNCENCCFKLFEMIPRLQSLRHFSTHFRFIGKQLFECLDRFPNLSYLEICCFHKIANDQVHADCDLDYKTGKLKEALDYLFRICTEKPRRLIKFQLNCEQISLSTDLKSPRNLKIIESKYH